MKPKKRHQTSSEESEESEASAKSSSSSDSESDDSSVSEHRHKKKRKRADSSESDSDSDGQKRAKKRKHKKKKKKHGKKKRRSHSVESVSAEEISISEGEISSKKKRKHKHKHKRARDSSASVEEVHVERRLHSVVKERRDSSEEGSHPSRTYYQRDHRQSASGDEPEYDREQEVQRFYRGSSKERAHHYSEHYHYDRERPDKYTTYQDKNYKERYGENAPYNEEFGRKPREYDEYRRHQRYEDRRPHEEYTRPKEDPYLPREDIRGYQNRYNEERGPKRRDFVPGREYRDRRPPEPDRYRDREYQDKRDRYQERFPSDRPPRDMRRERPVRQEKLPPPHRELSKSASPEDRYRERNRRPEPRADERYRDGRGADRRDPREREQRIEAREPRDEVRMKREPREDRSEDRRERSSRPEDKSDRPVKSDSKPRDRRSRFNPEEGKEFAWGKEGVKKEGNAVADKEKPNFGLSGKLTADTNTVNGVVIKYSEPDDAKQPKRRWRFYPFKGDKALPILYIHRQSAFLIGRDKKVVDIMLEHPSISKQHAALQYRATPFTRPDGSQGRRVRPYIIDLESANGTFVNNKKVEPRRYVELLERDVVKFGFSAREYVLLHENSKDDAMDDDNRDEGPTTTQQIRQDKRVKQELAEDGE